MTVELLCYLGDSLAISTEYAQQCIPLRDGLGGVARSYQRVVGGLCCSGIKIPC